MKLKNVGCHCCSPKTVGAVNWEGSASFMFILLQEEDKKGTLGNLNWDLCVGY